MNSAPANHLVLHNAERASQRSKRAVYRHPLGGHPKVASYGHPPRAGQRRPRGQQPELVRAAQGG